MGLGACSVVDVLDQSLTRGNGGSPGTRSARDFRCRSWADWGWMYATQTPFFRPGVLLASRACSHNRSPSIDFSLGQGTHGIRRPPFRLSQPRSRSNEIASSSYRVQRSERALSLALQESVPTSTANKGYHRSNALPHKVCSDCITCGTSSLDLKCSVTSSLRLLRVHASSCQAALRNSAALPFSQPLPSGS